MTLLNKFNTIDFKQECLVCGNHKIQKPDMTHANFDWQCEQCQTRQLDYIKSKGFRYYAFLLSGSWCSKYYYARSIREGYKLALKDYARKHEVYKSYLVGGVDQFVLTDWQSFE